MAYYLIPTKVNTYIYFFIMKDSLVQHRFNESEPLCEPPKSLAFKADTSLGFDDEIRRLSKPVCPSGAGNILEVKDISLPSLKYYPTLL